MVLQKGHKLQDGRYVIEEVLGKGGFGITYKVLHTALGGYLVIKTLNDDLRRDPDFDKYEEKFKQEARILQKLSQQKNKNIVRVTDLLEENKIWYLVMDFVEGESLQDLVKKRKLSETEAVNYIRQIGEALVVCHNKNLFHRDAHPGNIMILSEISNSPWFLIGYFAFFYSFIGFFAATSPLAWALAWALNWALNWAWTWAIFLLFAVLLWLKSITFAAAAYIGLFVIHYTMFFGLTEKLNKHIFLIIGGTSSFCLFLGWLVYQFFPIFGHR
jgi:serine/threonine protein kinase